MIPAKPLHIALFITKLSQVAVLNNTGYSPIQSVIYSIRWGHNLAGIEDCPTNHPLVKSSLEGAKRSLARPVRPKEPLPVDTVEKIAEHYASSDSLATIRFLFILLVGFAGFFRLNEIQNLELKDVEIFADHMSVRVPKRKNDQYREGHTSLIARSGKSTCPVAITEKLIKLLPVSDSCSLPLVRRIVKSKRKELYHNSKGISYSTVRGEFNRFVSPFVKDISIYGTHSIRSGAASSPACKNISAELLDMHVGWRCASSKFRYIKHSVSDRLKVSKAIGL